MNSDKESRAKNLLSPSAAKRFLVELANLGEETRDSERFWNLHRDFFPKQAFEFRDQVATALRALTRTSSDAVALQVEEGVAATLAAHPEIASEGLDRRPTLEELKRFRGRNLLVLRDWLREAWTIADPRRKEWRIYQLRQKFHQLTVGSVEQWSEPPPPSGMDYALRYLWKVADKSRRCANPDCAMSPYFLVERRSRRFCSDVCARPAQSAYKQLWWEQHREEVNKNRKKQYRKTKGQR